jgi:hypothetical protein
MHRVAPLLWFTGFVLWAFTGCGDQVKKYGGYEYDGPVNSCESDGDCLTGGCHPELSLCVAQPPDDGRSYYVKAIPETELNVPAQVFEITPDQSGTVLEPLELNTRVTVQGVTLADMGDFSVDLEATVIFTDVGNQLPGRAARIEVYESSSSVFSDLFLLPSTYNIIVLPEGDQAATHPVTYWGGVVLDELGVLRDASDEPMGLVVPMADVEVFGQVTQGGLPMNGLRVVAVDPENGRIVSTEDSSECEGPLSDEVCGLFSIGLAPGTEEFSLEVSRPGEPQHPEFTLTGFVVPDSAESVDLTDDPRLSLAPLGVPVRYYATVEKPVESSIGAILYDPAPGCFVLFESDSVAGGGVTRWVGTNEMGAIEEAEGSLGVNLYPGDYKVTVIPAEAPSEALTDYTAFISPVPITISGSAEIGGQVFWLNFRPLFKGNVLAAGEEVPVVTLVAQPHLGEADFPRSSTASTGFDGKFSLWLDPGTYRVVAEAPPESGFAWGTTVLEVDGNGSTDLGLPVPFVAGLSLATATAAETAGLEVGGAVVEWYFTDVDGRAYSIARVAADADGVVMALLPP